MSERRIVVDTLRLNYQGLFNLNEMGGTIWKRLDGQKTLKDIVEELSTEFEAPTQEIEGDVIGFVAELLKRGMLVEVSDV